MASVNYGRFIIKTEKKGDVWRARALKRLAIASPILEGITEEAALHLVKTFIDRAGAEERRERGSDGYPAESHVRAALSAIRKTKPQVDMLAAHRDAPDNILTATEIALAGGYKTYSSANSQYGALARLLAEEMDYRPPTRADGSTIWTFALAIDAGDSKLTEQDGQFRWRMRPEVVAALG